MKSSSSARDLARGIYESSSLARFRGWHYKQHVDREALRTKSVLQAVEFNPLTRDAFALMRGKEARTLFILGSGSSINSLTKDKFEEIKGGYSIGLNAWVSHTFVPDAYSFESDSIPAPPSLEINSMSEALGKRALSHPDTMLLLLRPKSAQLLHRMVEVPQTLRDRAFMYGRQNLLSRTDWALRKDLGRFLVDRLEDFGGMPVLIDNGASVVRMIEIGLFAGFKEIVLVGIDLNSSRYFWEAPDAAADHHDMRSSFRRPKNSKHDTLETIDRPYSNFLFIKELALLAPKVFNANLYLGTEGSSLAGALPRYHWTTGLP